MEPTGEESPYYRLEFDALDTIPSSVTIEIEGIKLVTEKELEVKLPLSDFHELLESREDMAIDERLAKIGDGEIYLDSLYFGDDGLGINILEKQERPEDNALDRISTRSMTLKSTVENASRDDLYKDWRFPNVISITNGEGIEPDGDQLRIRGQGSTTEGPYFSFEMKNDYVRSSKVIDLTLTHLTYRIYGPWIGEGVGRE